MVSPNTEQRFIEPTIAVLIDFENVGLDSIQYLFDQLSDLGRVIVKRAYADWSVHRNRRDQLLEHGIEAAHYFHATKSGKNASDIRLVIDAVDLMHTSSVDTYVVVSSDSDFVPLVNKLRSSGKFVVGAGRREITPITLVKSCDRYIYLDDSPEKLQGAEPRHRYSQSSKKPAGSTQHLNSRSAVVRALEASQDGQGQVPGSRLYQTMLRIDPSFNFKALGFSTFTRFLESRNEVKIVRSAGPGDILVQISNLQESKREQVVSNSERSDNWERDVDDAWRKRKRPRIAGQVAASDVARILDAPNLKSTKFTTLDRLLESSDYLDHRWRREGNTIIRI